MASSAADGASATSPRSATVIAAAMATAVMIDRVASSTRRSSGGRYMPLVESSPITRAGEDERPGQGHRRSARRKVSDEERNGKGCAIGRERDPPPGLEPTRASMRPA